MSAYKPLLRLKSCLPLCYANMLQDAQEGLKEPHADRQVL